MTEQAERMLLDYLSRVGDAAYGRLPARRRAAYLADLRTRVSRACADAGAERPEEVRRVLRSFGDPASLVARECGGDGGPRAAEPPRADAEDAPAARAATGNRRYRAAPWRAESAASGAGRPAGGAAPAGRGRLPDLAAGAGAVRRHPPEALSVVLYLVSGAVGDLAFLWVLGASMVALSGVWSRADRWGAVCGPIAATLVGMLLWRGEADYIDQFILGSLLDTGVVGLRLAAVGAGLYLAVRLVTLRGAPAAR
jgi:hypothetical protein